MWMGWLETYSKLCKPAQDVVCIGLMACSAVDEAIRNVNHQAAVSRKAATKRFHLQGTSNSDRLILLYNFHQDMWEPPI